MSTKFPDNIQTFGRFQDMTYNDWEMLSQYRQAMADSDFATAQQALRGISKLKNKLLTNGFMNDMLDTCYAVQDFFDNRQVPDYVVSMSQPTNQKKDDLWFELSGGYITFSSPSAFTINHIVNQKTWNGTMYYSTDAKIWNVWDGTTTLSSNSENKLYFRGINNTVLGKFVDNYYRASWVLTGENISCEGNLGNLLDFRDVASGRTVTMSKWGISYLFQKQSALISAPELPDVKRIPDSAYESLFMGTSISKAPNIYATTIIDSGCSFMFKDCVNLELPPIIAATSMGQNACNGMFSGCTALKALPRLYPKTYVHGEFEYMFENCSNIKISETKTGEYANEYSIPITKDGTKAGDYSFSRMFYGTGGTFVGNPTLNTTYYTSNEVI